MNAKPVLLYLTSAPLQADVIKRAEKAGYLPLGVSSLDDVKVLDVIPVGHLETISRCAMDALKNAPSHYSADSVREDFAIRVARALGTQNSQ